MDQRKVYSKKKLTLRIIKRENRVEGREKAVGGEPRPLLDLRVKGETNKVKTSTLVWKKKNATLGGRLRDQKEKLKKRFLIGGKPIPLNVLPGSKGGPAYRKKPPNSQPKNSQKGGVGGNKKKVQKGVRHTN